MTVNEHRIRGGEYKIRPAGRHILTIGRDLIKDNYAALIELVKNAYDADATSVDIHFSSIIEKVKVKGKVVPVTKLRIIIQDTGHGMDFSTIVNKWMVPSTDDKLERRVSPGGRTMQGRKGVGRYAASILGNELLLETITKKSEKTSLYIDWNEFETTEYLDDVSILIQSFETEEKPGTRIEILGSEEKLSEWNPKEIEKLHFELKKLISPFPKYIQNTTFDINLHFTDFPIEGYSDFHEQVKPFPIIDLFDYKISGSVTKSGDARLTFENNSFKGIKPDPISLRIKLDENEEYCGPLKVDIRVFDRDPESIQNLIDRGLRDPITDKPLGKLDARRLLNEYNGIGVYRNGFRIRPMGDPGYDWLQLDKKRVQNPAQNIGSDQVIGFIFVESEEISHLEEKSARDGLKENKYYDGLIKICLTILNQLETRRFQFRLNVGKGRKRENVNELIESLFNFSEVRQTILKELEALGAKDDRKDKVVRIISQKEIENNRIATILKEKIAVYQGQATLGKIINVILHEGRKPLSYFRNQTPIIREWAEGLERTFDKETFDKLINRVQTFTTQSDILTKLFSRIDPLAAKKRPRRKEFNVRKAVETVHEVFETNLKDLDIRFENKCNPDLEFVGWESDFYIALTNLIENSVYWLTETPKTKRRIEIDAKGSDGGMIMNYRDTGPGIDESLIESEVIFEPGFTTKINDGTGLGLAIAGEALERNDCKLKALYSDDGAHFRIETITH